MQGKPSLTIEGNRRKSLTNKERIQENPLLWDAAWLGGRCGISPGSPQDLARISPKTMEKTKETKGTRVCRPLGRQKPSRKPKKQRNQNDKTKGEQKPSRKPKKQKQPKFQNQWFWNLNPEPLVLKFVVFVFSMVFAHHWSCQFGFSGVLVFSMVFDVPVVYTLGFLWFLWFSLWFLICEWPVALESRTLNIVFRHNETTHSSETLYLA